MEFDTMLTHVIFLLFKVFILIFFIIGLAFLAAYLLEIIFRMKQKRIVQQLYMSRNMLEVFIDLDDVDILSEMSNFVPLAVYYDKEKETDKREWGRIYFGEKYITVLAVSCLKNNTRWLSGLKNNVI